MSLVTYMGVRQSFWRLVPPQHSNLECLQRPPTDCWEPRRADLELRLPCSGENVQGSNPLFGTQRHDHVPDTPRWGQHRSGAWVLNSARSSKNEDSGERSAVSDDAANSSRLAQTLGRQVLAGPLFGGTCDLAKTTAHMRLRGFVLDTKFGSKRDETKPIALTRRRQDDSAAKCVAGMMSPQARVQRIDEQIAEAFIQQILEDIVDELQSVPQEQFSERMSEQIVDVPVPQVDVQDNTNAIEALKLQVRPISNEIQEEALRSSLSVNDQLTKLNEQMGLLMEEKMGYAAAFGIDERRNVTGYIKELCVQRDELNQEIQAKLAVLHEQILKVYRRCASASEFGQDLRSGEIGSAA